MINLLYVLLYSIIYPSTASPSPAAFSITENNASTIIEMKVESGQAFLFNYWDEVNAIQKLEFKNTSSSDSVISKTIALKRPTHLTRGLFSPAATKNKMVFHMNHYLLLPGDTLRLNSSGDQLSTAYYSGGRVQVGDLFWFPTTYDPEFEQYQEYKAKGFSSGFNPHNTGTWKRISDSSKQSLNKIEDYYKKGLLSRRYHDALQRFNLLNNYNSAAVYSTIYAGFDSLYKEIFQSIDRWSGISSRMNNNLLSLAFSQLNKTLDTTRGQWEIFISLPTSLKQKAPVAEYLLYRLKSDKVTKNKDSLQAQLTAFAKGGFTQAMFADYYQQYLLERFKNNVDAPLVSLRGDTITFKQLMSSLRGKYVFVDIWASWCAPCYGQLPYLEKAKSELKNENIVFVSLSADNESQHPAWLNAAQKQGLSNNALDFRFKSGFRNMYLEVNKITAIPRYLLFDTKGDILDSDFIQPSNPKYKAQLLAYMRR